MGAYTFQRRFVPYVKDGSKPHTIRSRRRHPDKPGNRLRLQTGPRMKPELLFYVPCCSVVDVVIEPAARYIEVDGSALSEDEANLLAWIDGFRSTGDSAHSPGQALTEMLWFWETEHPEEKYFVGHKIGWDFERREKGNGTIKLC